MSHRRDKRALFGAHLVHRRHERNVSLRLEPFLHVGAENRRRKWPESFTPLDLCIEGFPNIGATGIAQDGPVTQGSRTPFHSALKAPHDLPVGNRTRSTAA